VADLDPLNPQIHLFRARVLRWALGRPDDALAASDRAAHLDPHDVTAHYYRGYALDALRRHHEALAAFRQALAQEPDYARAREYEGIVLAVLGDFGKALAELDAARDLAPDGTGEGMAWAAASLWHLGDKTGARKRFALVEGRVTGCTPFRVAEMEAIALCGLGQPEEAVQNLRNAMRLRVPGDQFHPRSIYELLSHPLLPGADRLQVFANSKH
jgi:tetratricopeptide (TPR) repeat protein